MMKRYAVKRCMDVIFSFTGLIILTPVFFIIALAIKLNSPGPVFFVQERIGQHGIPFPLFKFRTMYRQSGPTTPITVGERDRRITGVGYWLRRYKLDELPQLINVLKGDMSLVGPRPEIRKFVDLYSEEEKMVLTVKPGITDPASIAYRNESRLLDGRDDPVDYYVRVIMPAKLSLNREYIRNQSLWLDVRIILKTIFLLFKRND